MPHTMTRCLFGLLVCLFMTDATSADQTPTLDVEPCQLRFDPETGAFLSLLDKTTGHEHIAQAAPDSPWAVDIHLDEPLRILPTHGTAFSWKHEDEPTQTLHLRWSSFGFVFAPDLHVCARFSWSEERGALLCDIEISGLNDAPIGAVRFPRLPALAPQNKEILAAPYWMGEKTDQARSLLSSSGGTPGRREFTYPGLLSMQCMTLYGEGGSGLYLAADDIEARSKSFAAFGDGKGGLGLEISHFPGADDLREEPWRPAYASLIGVFQGDWFTVAERYRDWALQQPWAKNSRLRNSATPQWVTDTGFWVWNRGASPGVLPHALALQAYLGVPVSVFWHWWHGCAYDVGFPEYLPPREGADAFRSALESAQQQGIYAIVYMNQRLWGMTTESWETENAERYAVKRPDGQVQPEIYNTFTQSPCASMCMGTSFWRNTYAGLTREAFSSLRVNGIYMDQACSSLVCYDTNHEHAPGGGLYWMEGFRQLESGIRQHCPGIALAGEGCGESWLPHLDLMLSLQVSMERYAAPGVWTPIPFFHAVYHGYTTLYGNYASLTYPPYDELWPPEFAPAQPLTLLDPKFAHQFKLEQARTFVWGQQPCLANFTPEQLTERAEELAFVRQLARLRQQALSFLLHGVFLRPPTSSLPEMEIPMSRLSIYAGQRDAVQEFSKHVAPVLLAAWRNEEGAVAVPAVNISDTEAPLGFHLTAQDHALPSTGVVYKRTEQQRVLWGRFENGTCRVEDVLEPGEACIYEFEPEA